MINKNIEIASIINKSNPSTMNYYRFIQLVDKNDLLNPNDDYKSFLVKMFLKQNYKKELFEKLLNNFEYFYRNNDELLLLKNKLVLIKTLYVKWKVA